MNQPDFKIHFEMDFKDQFLFLLLSQLTDEFFYLDDLIVLSIDEILPIS